MLDAVFDSGNPSLARVFFGRSIILLCVGCLVGMRLICIIVCKLPLMHYGTLLVTYFSTAQVLYLQ